MTETCGGCIYSKSCPSFDTARDLEFANLGKPIDNAQVRVVDYQGVIIRDTTQGKLQLNGQVVFGGYYRNEKATIDAFTEDGWFETGDAAFFDGHGYLNLAGRVNDTLVINGYVNALS